MEEMKEDKLDMKMNGAMMLLSSLGVNPKLIEDKVNEFRSTILSIAEKVTRAQAQTNDEIKKVSEKIDLLNQRIHLIDQRMAMFDQRFSESERRMNEGKSYVPSDLSIYKEFLDFN